MVTGNNSKHRDIDGGYAWVILMAAFLCHGLVNGSHQVFGVLYIEVLEIYEGGKFLTSWIITVQTTFCGLSG